MSLTEKTCTADTTQDPELNSQQRHPLHADGTRFARPDNSKGPEIDQSKASGSDDTTTRRLSTGRLCTA